MTSHRDPRSPWWGRLWSVWFWGGVIYELLTLAVGSSAKPLTKWLRAKILGGAVGSAVAGMLLVWAIWHLLFDIGGRPGAIDAVFGAAGAYVGLLGFAHRQRQLGVLEENDP